jgi:hypothetical protein
LRGGVEDKTAFTEPSLLVSGSIVGGLQIAITSAIVVSNFGKERFPDAKSSGLLRNLSQGSEP